MLATAFRLNWSIFDLFTSCLLYVNQSQNGTINTSIIWSTQIFNLRGIVSNFGNRLSFVQYILCILCNPKVCSPQNSLPVERIVSHFYKIELIAWCKCAFYLYRDGSTDWSSVLVQHWAAWVRHCNSRTMRVISPNGDQRPVFWRYCSQHMQVCSVDPSEVKQRDALGRVAQLVSASDIIWNEACRCA